MVGSRGSHTAAGLEGGHPAEQLASCAGARVRKAEMLRLADEDYPISARRLDEVIKHPKPGAEMWLIDDGNVIADAMVRCMLAAARPDMGYVAIGNTSGKDGRTLRELNAIPTRVQSMVGNADEVV